MLFSSALSLLVSVWHVPVLETFRCQEKLPNISIGRAMFVNAWATQSVEMWPRIASPLLDCRQM